MKFFLQDMPTEKIQERFYGIQIGTYENQLIERGLHRGLVLIEEDTSDLRFMRKTITHTILMKIKESEGN